MVVMPCPMEAASFPATSHKPNKKMKTELKIELQKRWAKNGIWPSTGSELVYIGFGFCVFFLILGSLMWSFEKTYSTGCFGAAFGAAVMAFLIFVLTLDERKNWRKAVKALKANELWDLKESARIRDFSQAVCSKLTKIARRVVTCEEDLKHATDPNLISRALDMLHDAKVASDAFWSAVGPDGLDLVSDKKPAFDAAKKELGL